MHAFVAADFRANGEFLRVWYISNGRDLALVTYVALEPDSPKLAGEIEEADEIAKSLDFGWRMGHPASFFITAKDARTVEAALRATGDFVIVYSRSPTATPHLVEHLDFTENGKQWLFFLLVLREHLCDVRTNHVPERGYWTIDALTAPVVEFNRSFFDGRIIRRGRVYYVDGFYGPDDAWVEKPEAFRTWAAKALRTVKKALTKRGTAYVGTEAGTWLDAGGKVDPPYDEAMLQERRRKAAR